MKIVPILLLALLSLSFIVIAPLSIGTSYAQKLKDPDFAYGIVTIDNVKGRSLEVTAFIGAGDSIGTGAGEQDKKIQGSPEPIDKTSTQVRHTFKWNNDDFPPNGIIRGTAWTACIEFKNGKGGESCFTDSFNSATQPDRITLDADYIRED
jgi:hypothetical protein